MAQEEATRLPYNDRSDVEKLISQWVKIGGIIARNHEWSAVVVRAATAAEIAANIAIRKRFSADSTLSEKFVDSLLVWANGLPGKLDHLIIPMENDEIRNATLTALRQKVKALNKKRNAIVHKGEFTNKKDARELIATAREIVEVLLSPYEPGLHLKELKWAKRKEKAK